MSEPIGNDEILPEGNDSEEENEEDEPKDETILFSPGKITIGDKEFGPVKDSRGYAAGFRIDEGQKTIDYFYWTDNELDVPSDTLAHESCILNYGLTYGAGSESVTETFQVELDLSFAE